MFKPWPKIARLSREIIITEKIDGTNAAVVIVDANEADRADNYTAAHDGMLLFAQSRTRIIQPGDDNFGFAAWVRDNAAELAALGPGYHFGEWWGKGIQRGYSQTKRAFSLFNVTRWAGNAPACCSVVPVLYQGTFGQSPIEHALRLLRTEGSVAAPGFMDPEGIVIFHTAANALFKKTIKGDESPKGVS